MKLQQTKDGRRVLVKESLIRLGVSEQEPGDPEAPAITNIHLLSESVQTGYYEAPTTAFPFIYRW